MYEVISPVPPGCGGPMTCEVGKHTGLHPEGPAEATCIVVEGNDYDAHYHSCDLHLPIPSGRSLVWQRPAVLVFFCRRHQVNLILVDNLLSDRPELLYSQAKQTWYIDYGDLECPTLLAMENKLLDQGKNPNELEKEVCEDSWVLLYANTATE